MRKPLRVIVCHGCMSGPVDPKPPRYNLEMRDDGIYERLCSDCGYLTISLDQNFRFEVLAEMGLLSYSERAFNESVVSFAVCLERFFEFAVLVYTIRQGGNSEEFNHLWKRIGRQSERQRGAFELAATRYAQERGEPWPTFPDFDKLSALRNRVAHGGFLISPVECQLYCSEIYTWVRKSQIYLVKHEKEACSNATQHCTKPRYNEATKRLKGKKGGAWTGPIETVISSFYSPMKLLSFDKAVDSAVRNYEHRVSDIGPPIVD